MINSRSAHNGTWDTYFVVIDVFRPQAIWRYLCKDAGLLAGLDVVIAGGLHLLQMTVVQVVRLLALALLVAPCSAGARKQAPAQKVKDAKTKDKV